MKTNDDSRLFVECGADLLMIALIKIIRIIIIKNMAKIYKKKKRQLRHYLASTFNLYTRKMSLKKLKFFYQEFQFIQEYINRINKNIQI